MNCGKNNEQELRFLQLRFIGKIMAGFTHEIKNYLAIIKESAGLIGDMVKKGKMSKNDIPEYLDIVHSIEDQIEKATEQFTYLNRFSHRMDSRLSTFNLNECLGELIALVQPVCKAEKCRDRYRSFSKYSPGPFITLQCFSFFSSVFLRRR